MSSDLQERLERLVAPPAPAGFRERLWERAEERERIVARRWRATALAALVVAAGATGVAGVMAFGGGGEAGVLSTYDRTLSCPIAIQGGVPVARLEANATHRFFNNGKWVTFPAIAAVMDTNGQGFGGISNVRRGYGFATPNACRATKAVPLMPAGLPLEGVYLGKDDGLGSLNGATCLVGPRVSVRVHATVGRDDTPVSGLLAMWTGKKPRPVAFVRWAPKRVEVYVSADCRT